MKLIISFILWFILAIILIGVYTYTIWIKLDKFISSLDNPVSCILPYWVQDKIEKTYENITSATCEITK